MYNDQAIKALNNSNLVSSEPTLLASVFNGGILQVTPTGIFYFSNDWVLVSALKTKDIEPDESENKIVLACVCNNIVCVVMKSDVLVNIQINGQAFSII